MPAKFSVFTVAAMPIIPIALACGGDDGGGKITVRPDSNIADAAPVVCTAAPTYGDVLAGSNTQFAGSDGIPGMTMGSDSYSVYWLGRMDPTAMPDFIQLTLYEGYGAFSTGLTPKTVQLTGDEAAYATCGACLFMFTDLHQGAGSGVEITDYYMPTAGTLTLTSVADQFEGTISGLMLQHMVISGNDLVPANDGCVASVPTLTMNAAIEAQEMMANGKGEPGAKTFRFKLSNRTF